MKYFVATVPPEQLQDICLLLRFHKAGRSCSPRLEKRSLFSPPPPCAKSMARGFRCLRAAIRAARPEPRQHFWKIAGSKNFSFACGSLLTANHPKKQLLLSKKSLLFLQNIPKIKWFVAKLFHTFYSQNFIIFLFSVVCINCFYSIRCVFNTSKIIDYWLLINNCL